MVWGGLHGLGQIAERVWNRYFPPKKEMGVIRVLVTFAFVTFAWLFFRANDMGDALYVLAHMFDGVTRPVEYAKNCYLAFKGAGLIQSTELKLVFFWIFLLMAHDFIALKTDVAQWLGRFRKPVRYAFYFALLFIVLYSRQLGQYDFVYFQF